MTGKTFNIQIPEARFTLFDAKRDGLPEVIVANDALLAFPHPELFPWHLRVRLEVEEIVQNGMPSPAESKLLFERIADLSDRIYQADAAHEKLMN